MDNGILDSYLRKTKQVGTDYPQWFIQEPIRLRELDCPVKTRSSRAKVKLNQVKNRLDVERHLVKGQNPLTMWSHFATGHVTVYNGAKDLSYPLYSLVSRDLTLLEWAQMTFLIETILGFSYKM